MGNGIRNDLRIEKLVYWENGLGHDRGKAVFGPLTAPVDIVSWRSAHCLKTP